MTGFMGYWERHAMLRPIAPFVLFALCAIASWEAPFRYDRLERWQPSVATVAETPTECGLVKNPILSARWSEHEIVLPCAKAAAHTSRWVGARHLVYRVPIVYRAPGGAMISAVMSSDELGVGAVEQGDRIPILVDPDEPTRCDGVFGLRRDWVWLVFLPLTGLLALLGLLRLCGISLADILGTLVLPALIGALEATKPRDRTRLDRPGPTPSTHRRSFGRRRTSRAD